MSVVWLMVTPKLGFDSAAEGRGGGDEEDIDLGKAPGKHLARNPHHFLFQAVVPHVEDADPGVERSVVFDVARDEDVGAAGFGLGKQRGSGARAVGKAAYRAGNWPADGGRGEADAAAQELQQAGQAHRFRHVAHEAEARAFARGLQQLGMHERQFPGQPAGRAVGLHVRRSVRGVKGNVRPEEQGKRFVVAVELVRETGREGERMVGEDKLCALAERLPDRLRRGIEGHGHAAGLGAPACHLEAGLVPAGLSGQRSHGLDGVENGRDEHAASGKKKHPP